MSDRAAPSEISEPGRSFRVDVSSGQTEAPEPADASAAPHTAPTVLDMALELAARSLPVFPCGTNKRPLIKGGKEFSNASTDPNRIREMWEQAGPAAKLIGVPTGRASGFDVLDVDPRHNGDAWETENSDRLGETRMHSTPSGGRHWLFAHAEGVRNIQDGKTIAPGIDVRGQGGYVCFPPSGGYSVIHDVDIAPWPDWLLPLVLKVAKPAFVPAPSSYATPARITDNRLCGWIDREVRRVRDAPIGGRHNARLTASRSIGGVAAEARLSDTEAEEMLIAARPPEVEEEKERRTIRDGLAYGRAAPIDLNTLPDSAQFHEYQQHRSNGGAPPPDPRQPSVPAFMRRRPPPDDISLPEPEERKEHFSDAEPDTPESDQPAPEGDQDEPLVDAALPDLFVLKADLPLVSQQLRDRLAQHPWLFERGVPARLTCYQPAENRPAEIHPLGVEGILHAAHEVCRPYKVDGRGKRNDVTLPDPVAKLYLALNGRWNLRPLHGICGSVLLDNDGGIHAHEGYHEPSGLWCTRAPALNVPDRPAKDEAVDALYRLRAAMRTFTFKASPLTRIDGIDADVVDIEQPPSLCESAALNGLLTAVCRASLPLAPGVMVNAPSMSGSGAGKGLWVRMVVAIAYGIIAKAGTAGHDEKELEKRIGSVLMRGDPVIFLDNLNNTLLRSPQLESCLTELLVSIRHFGVLKLQDVRCTAFVAVTGNGLQASTDTARRFIYPTIEPPLDNPGERQYPPGFLAGILARRAELLSDALTIWRWGRQQPHPNRGLPFGSYERWTEWVRDPLLALGCRDPVEGAQDARDHDPARINLTGMFTEWRLWHGDNWVKADDLNFHVRRLIDDKERTAAIRQKLSPLASTRLGGFMLESKVEGNAANRVSLYRVIEIAAVF